MRFSVGDKVIVRTYEEMKKEYGTDSRGCIFPSGDGGPLLFLPGMDKYGGHAFFVSQIDVDGYRLRDASETFSDLASGGSKFADIWQYGFTDEMLKPAPRHGSFSSYPADGEIVVDNVNGGILVSFAKDGKLQPLFETVVFTPADEKDGNPVVQVQVSELVSGNDKDTDTPTLEFLFANGKVRCGEVSKKAVFVGTCNK